MLKLQSEDEGRVCKVCDLIFYRNRMKEHKDTLEHMEAQKRKYGESECNVCKERFIKGYWKEHKRSKAHVLVSEQIREARKVKIRVGTNCDKEIYDLRVSSEENQQYINTLATFLAVRYALNYSGKDFKISVNNKLWKDFGDIVIEVTDSDRVEIEAIRCKKIENKNNYSVVALSAESGKLSLKEQCQILEKLRKNDYFQNANFKLYTISSLAIDNSSKLVYTEDIISNWQKTKDAEFWSGKEIEIKQPKSKRRDLLNTTDDQDDICIFHIAKNGNLNLHNDLNRFRLYINQKNKIELHNAIRSMIEERFNVSVDLSDDLIRFVKKYFKTDKTLKKNECNYKMMREDILLKIAEHLLVPFLYIPERAIKEENLQLWNDTIQQFEIIIMKDDDATLQKVYTGMNYILKEETRYIIDNFNNVQVEPNNIINQRLKPNVFNHDGTIKFLYLALWKSGLLPLVLKIENEKHLRIILDVMSFSKSEQLPLKVIIVSDFKIRNCFPEQLTVFRNVRDLHFMNSEILVQILEIKVKVLDFDLTLKDIVRNNIDFLKKLTPDALLNLLFQEFSIRDINVPITEDLLDYTIVLDDKHMNQIRKYFQRKEGSRETALSYLVNVKGQTNRIQVPSKL